ncbi:MAG: response regulator transcription factor [Firmicutes bacterium]|nr:response regulator transcription factor [Bacillota bacterium]
MANILICDDEKDIVSALTIYLNAEGYTTFAAYTGEEALQIIATQPVHLVLMDIMMPGIDGIAATAKLRESSNVPVILLTAKSEDTDKVLGLNIGADDYVTKPFNPVELLARVKSQLRRYMQLGGTAEKENILTSGSIQLNDESKTVTVDGEPVNLTPLEYSILRLLMENPGKVYSSAQIYTKVWNSSAFGADGTVAVHIRHLREKIEIDPANPRYLKVAWGQGYKLEKGD